MKNSNKNVKISVMDTKRLESDVELKRSRFMSHIKNKNTGIEILVRKKLHALGFRYTLHQAGLAGKPDIVLPRWKVAIFVNGCFWHLHGCALSSIPKTNTAFWTEKLQKNKNRDSTNISILINEGWRVAEVWECAVKGKDLETKLSDVAHILDTWIRNSDKKPLIKISDGLNEVAKDLYEENELECLTV